MARAATAGSGGRLHFSATRANTRRMASRVGAGSDPFWSALIRTASKKMSPRERGVCFYAVFSRLARGGRSISSRRRGPLVWVKQAETAPTDGSKPGPRRDHG